MKNYEIVDGVEKLEAAIARVRAAQQRFATYTQEQVDRIFLAAAIAANQQRIPLAKLAVEETGMGVVEDKVIKNHYAAEYIYNAYKDTKTCGVIEEDKSFGIRRIAEPIGVIAAVIPTTNPTSTAIFKTLVALKTRNGIIISPHPRAKHSTIAAAKVVLEAAVAAGAPEGIIRWVDIPSLEMTNLAMKEADIILATGGPGMVKAAYSSGKPALGVGAGNVQSLVDTDVDLEQAAEKIARSRTYDNGVLCTCEQCVHIPSAKFDAMVALLQAQGGAYIGSDADVAALRKAMFPNGSINKDVVGSTPQAIAALAGLTVPEEARFLLVRVTKGGRDEDLTKEKLCPVLAICPYDSWEGAVDLAVRNLKNEGAGHSTILHSNNKAHVEYAAVRLPVSRIGVNLVGSSGLGGGFDCGLNPTATLGCGTWGNNSISENLWWHHLVNISRIAYQMPNNPVPTDEEIGAE